jgi:uncharacterized protein YdaL
MKVVDAVLILTSTKDAAVRAVTPATNAQSIVVVYTNLNGFFSYTNNTFLDIIWISPFIFMVQVTLLFRK